MSPPERLEDGYERTDEGQSWSSEVFGDVLSSKVLDPDAPEGEFRYLIFGQSISGRSLVVSYTERDERVRLISARDMTAPERKAYEQ
jgi:uncharacterized DUF497 family protein